MNDQEINQAIATHCSWEYDEMGGKCHCPEISGLLVDVTKDLNAMHEAEKQLSIDQEYNYGEELRRISENVGPKGGHFTPNGWGCYSLAHLTAKQKAEAFVKIINHETSKRG
jgi:hypothetical protein